MGKGLSAAATSVRLPFNFLRGKGWKGKGGTQVACNLPSRGHSPPASTAVPECLGFKASLVLSFTLEPSLECWELSDGKWEAAAPPCMNHN